MFCWAAAGGGTKRQPAATTHASAASAIRSETLDCRTDPERLRALKPLPIAQRTALNENALLIIFATPLSCAWMTFLVLPTWHDERLRVPAAGQQALDEKSVGVAGGIGVAAGDITGCIDAVGVGCG